MDDRNVILANFQACTAIDDISVCLAILEQHNWDLQNAVHAAIENPSAPSGSQPNPTIPNPPTSSRQIKFNIKYNGGQQKSINFDEDGMVGTLLQIIQVECQIGDGGKLKLTGWPTGDQPDNDLPLSVLNFPSIVNLNHHGSSSTSSTSTFSSSVPQSSTINSHSSEDRKFKHFTLKIHDVDNNDRHELKYPGVKKVKSIKDDVYSLTLIPSNRQVWSGWPSNVGDEKALYELETPSLTLDLRVDDNRPREITGRAVNMNNAIRNDDSDNDDSDEEIDYPEEDEEFLFEEDVTPSYQSRNQKVALVTDTSGDYSLGTMQFMEEFQRRFGEQTPIWFIGTMEDAAKEAYGAHNKVIERKMLAVYIHNERSIQSNIFCSQILSSNAIVSFLGENCISWGFDVTNLNNKQRMYSQVDKMFGGRIAQTLRRLNDDEYPILIFSFGRGNANHETLELIKGECDVDQVMTKMIVAKDQADSRKSDDQKAEMLREQRENEISNQESEYEKSLRADREKMRLEEEEKKKKIEAEEQKKIEEESLRQHQEEMGNQLPPEPSKDEKNVSQLRFRFPDGRNAIRRFRQSERLQVLFIFIGSEGFSESTHKIIRMHPRADLTVADRSKSLKDHGLIQDNLIVESSAVDDESEDESDDSMEE